MDPNTLAKQRDDSPGFSIRVDRQDTPDEYRLASRGFFIGFPNGYRISVQFGKFNHCDCIDRQSPVQMSKEMYYDWLTENCPTAEIGIWNPQGELMDFQDGDSIRGYTDPETFAKILAWVVALPGTKTTGTN